MVQDTLWWCLVHVKYPLASLGKSVESGGGEAIPALTAPSLQKLPLLVLTHPTNPNPYTFPTPLTPPLYHKKNFLMTFHIEFQ